jgi:hypothetical protein
VQRVRIELAPAAYQVSGDRPWRTPLEAQQSARWVASTVLTTRDWWLDQKLGDAQIDALARRVDVTANAELATAAVRVDFELADGTVVHDERDTAPGDPEEPLNRSQIEAKLRQAAQSASLDADEILAAVDGRSYGKLAALLSSTLVRA